ncbi:MAG: hypothetical protein WCR20_17590 [Verrucomicrobiota bacterium]
MSTIIIPSDLDHVPFDNTDLLYLRVHLTPENYNSFDNNPDLLNNIRLSFFTGTPASYPRFDPGSWPYKLHVAPEQNLITNLVNNPTFSDFETITTSRVNELKKRAEKYEEIYFFYGGGIDATVMLCAMLINWDEHTLSKVRLVMSQSSIDENPLMYRDYIRGKFNIIRAAEFYSGKYKLSNDAMFTGGWGADDISGYDSLPQFDAAYPGAYKNPWRKNIDLLVDYLSSRSGERKDGVFSVDTIKTSLEKHRIEVDTVFDFLSWVPFNWGYNIGVYAMSYSFGHVPDNIDHKKWIQENCFTFYNCEEFQYWHLGTIGSEVRMGATANMYKYSAKKYIYDFNKDREYFINKLKIKSTPLNIEYGSMHRMYAVDTDYNFYYQQSPQTPWPNR